MTDYSPLREAVPKVRHGFGIKAALLSGHLLRCSATFPEITGS